MTEKRDDVRVSQKFSASAERVFDAWLNPSTAKQFLFATPTGTMIRADIDARVGGEFTFVDRRDGVDVLHTGKYLELVRPTRIRFTFGVPMYSPNFAEVTIDIVANENGCVVTLTQGGTLPEYREQTIKGWSGILERAAKTIESLRS